MRDHEIAARKKAERQGETLPYGGQFFHSLFMGAVGAVNKKKFKY